MIIDSLDVTCDEFYSRFDSWRTVDSVILKYSYPLQGSVHVKGSIRIPWKKAKKMTLEEMENYAKREVKKAVQKNE